jgi:hypothetical protein
MNIIRMAQEADAEITNYINYAFDENVILFGVDQLERFAALVAAVEREACAQLCDEYVVPVSIEGAHPDYLIGKQMAFQQAARAIRERGEK